MHQLLHYSKILITIIVLLFIICAAIGGGFKKPKPNFSKIWFDKPTLFAHRGVCTAQVPENTTTSVQLAKKIGFEKNDNSRKIYLSLPYFTKDLKGVILFKQYEDTAAFMAGGLGYRFQYDWGKK